MKRFGFMSFARFEYAKSHVGLFVYLLDDPLLRLHPCVRLPESRAVGSERPALALEDSGNRQGHDLQAHGCRNDIVQVRVRSVIDRLAAEQKSIHGIGDFEL